ncbi:MAG: PASTA domain-containing protein, partial [Candidatus Hydrogenedentes bacterium]|nr:PASTA domain-containing protein [Candidatus Hydrogenedentota bacterium]
GTPEGVVEGTPEGVVEGTPEGVVEGTPEGVVEGEGEGTIELVEVPYVIGLDEASANSQIIDAGLVVGSVYEVCSDDYPSGYVVAQDPAGGNTAELGSAVDLWVSCGPCVDVPDVVGKDQSDAISDIVSAGLEVGSIIQVCDNDIPYGYVVAQDPGAITNTCFLPNTDVIPVDIYVSCGPCTTIPDVTELQLTSAISVIAGYGLVVDDIISVCDDDLPVGTVKAQDPLPVTNSCVLPNTTAVPVDLYVVCGPCYSVQFPYVVGNSEALAVAILTSNGFNVDDIIYICSDDVPSGYVISQYPPSDPNTPPVVNTCNLDVDLTVSTGPC